ncbi:aldo/keto reductase [Dehalococcoidia bacterium]|nr:aldo/keto reductase [Dehalococcoidia bacterium]
MEYRRLGKTGMKVSAVGLGTNNFGGRSDEAASLRVIDQALDLEANFIDTANIYTKQRSEEIIGKALKGKRDKAILATKFGMYMGEGPNMMGGSRKHIFDQIEGSLKRLQTDYLDLYQIHAPDRNTPIEETLRALDDLIRQGKIRYIGTSNFAAWHSCEADWAAQALNVNSFVSEQPHYNVLKRDAEREVIPFCRQYGIGIIPFYPLEGGLLTGKYRKGESPPSGARITGLDEGSQARYFSERNFDLIGKLEAFAQRRDHTLLELAMAWLLANDTVCSVIAGATKPEQVVDNVKALDWKLTPQEMDEINDLAPM